MNSASPASCVVTWLRGLHPQDAYTLLLRPATRREPSPALQRPPPAAFNRCTLPVVLMADWPFNFGEFFANAASAADLILRRRLMLPGATGWRN